MVVLQGPLVDSIVFSCMGCTVREKHIRTARRTRSAKPELDPCCLLDKPSIPKSILDPGLKPPLGCYLGLNDYSAPNPNSNTPDFGDHGWGFCTEEQLEEILLKNLEFLYNEAISKLVALGYDEDAALKAVLRNGHCYGGMDILTNILHHSLSYLNGSSGSSNDNSEESEPDFSDLRELEEYALADMVCLLQQLKPQLSKGDAMWCLLMSDLHVGRATAMDLPALPSQAAGGAIPITNSVESIGNAGGAGIVSPALCRFHGGWGFGNGSGSDFAVNGFLSYSADMLLHKDIECPKRFNLSPSLKSLLKRNVAMFAAGFRANSKQVQTQNKTCVSAPPMAYATPAVPESEVPAQKSDESHNSESQDVNLVLSKFRDLNIGENLEQVGEDQKDEMIVTLLHQIKDLEKQVKERKEWAHQKAMQAARKLSTDLAELKILRMEREETQRMKKGKQTLEDSTMKRLSDMENALRKASVQVDRANAAVRRLETENAEIRAEMEAAKLSASESITTCLQVAKREKKLMAWEKQKSKLQQEIAEENEKVKELQQCLAKVQQEAKEFESKLRQEVKAKGQAMAQVEEEQRLKEAVESNNKRKLESLRLKIEVDFQRHKDDLQRLEQELSRLKLADHSSDANYQANTAGAGRNEGARAQPETIVRLLHELDKMDDSSEKEVDGNRECILCLKDEVSIVFLPCAHQVLCANCNDSFGKKGRVVCPCCHAPIEQRICVFGASS